MFPLNPELVATIKYSIHATLDSAAYNFQCVETGSLRNIQNFF